MSGDGAYVPLPQGFDPTYFRDLAAVEDRHFWFRSRNEAIVTLLRRVVGPDDRMLEVGCGNGNVLGAVTRAFPSATTVGMDLLDEGLQFARGRGNRLLIQGDVRSPPLRGQFDVIGAFDVIEHLDDDVGTLARMRRLLRPGGHIVVTVPAGPSLWSYFDEACGHRRRYRTPDLDRALQEAGFEVTFLSPYMASLVPMVWMRRKVGDHRRRSGRKDTQELATEELRVPPGVNGLLGFVLRQETRVLARGRSLPFGTSLVAIARNGPEEPAAPSPGQSPPTSSTTT